MRQTSPFLSQNFEQLPFEEFTRKAYLNYSMYVILDRALPHIGDELFHVRDSGSGIAPHWRRVKAGAKKNRLCHESTGAHCH